MTDRNNTPDQTASIADDLRAAFKEAETVETPVEATPEVDKPASPARDESGRFAAKSTQEKDNSAGEVGDKREAPAAKPDPADAGNNVSRETIDEKQSQNNTLTPPSGWSVAGKTAFSGLPEAVKADIAKRETEIAEGFRRYKERETSYRDVAAVIEPRMQELSQTGVSAAQAVERLFAVADLIVNDTERAIMEIANGHGVNLAALAARQGGQPAPNGTGQPAVDPRIASIEQRLAEIQGHFTEAQRSQALAERSAADNEIASFASDPKHVYFENVRADMARLLQGGFADTLPKAYEMACSLHPEISAHLLKERVQSELTARQKEQASRTASARAAAGSLTGAPQPGTAGQPVPKDNLRAELEEQFRAARI